ncbi:hypothetical protein I5H21_gp047 [Mycobacterium phage Byougenkin]|uniref:Uncharacterized protein n=1 Tax=Mycobacterium phage Byougenkin TaxID=2182394 RepID=A0A2U8UN99_9CAUD|nr:hypothetical protein I5H21_gp047 [Mycobacterium phage Byougenkin]AWN04971.1 hypothetical protein SEA_BYOUGENKIN_47 [Mycobacterium phage Byougenkin]UVG34723.1 hypothetical protein SEA_RITA_51 [Mycobacterium phage Rita]
MTFHSKPRPKVQHFPKPKKPLFVSKPKEGEPK